MYRDIIKHDLDMPMKLEEERDWSPAERDAVEYELQRDMLDDEPGYMPCQLQLDGLWT
jgi:hypothetical protein